MAQANLDLGILKDTKFTYGDYTRELNGYIVVSMGAPIRYCVGVEVFYRVQLQFYVKALQQFGPNVFRIQMVTREHQ